ncbi:MAG TPA: pseudouridine synthase [Candidatus Saccharimonadales bacterium]|nr:pseudouridine synthase [Candidatus Saccharimonadales bacterium]
MRINKFIALHSSLSRRAADQAIANGQVQVNGQPASPGQDVGEGDIVLLKGQPLAAAAPPQTIMLNKPIGYVVSREGQGSKTVYELLPADLQQLQPIGRLDKNSSGLLLFTNDGQLAYQLTHPSFQKIKIYEVLLDKPLAALHHQLICDIGVTLEDGPSKLALEKLDQSATAWRVIMHEGRNRQIRRTFAALGYDVQKLHRTQFGDYQLAGLASGELHRI